MYRTKHILVHTLLLSFALLFLASCYKEDEEPSKVEVLNGNIYQVMKTYYLWYREIPSLNPGAFKTPYALLDAIRSRKDRWSMIMTWEEFHSYFEEGDYVGHGVSFKGDEEGNLVVAFLFDKSPLKAAGVGRGWILKSVNGTTISPETNFNTLFGEDVAGVENTFVFEDLEGQSKTIVSKKQIISINTVLEKKILEAGGKNVGYLAFESFITPSTEELDSAFSYFNSTGIQELIVDLRYNGGGQMDVAQHLAGLISSSKHGGKIFCKYQHNDKVSSLDTTVTIPAGMSSPNLERVFFIASRGSASASEAMINGLDPWMDVQVVGDSTYGKSVGMYVVDFSAYGYMFMPVCFKLSNANNFGDYLSGLPANAYVEDDLKHALGSPDELCTKAILNYISTGSYPAAKKSHRQGPAFRLYDLPGYKAQNPVF
ncbi:MAG: S41 family peptidase [Bacteroidales bacterium]